jgi:hypothetical protein
MQPLRLAAAVAAALLSLTAASPGDPETIVVHVPLRAHDGSAAPAHLRQSYVRALAVLGSVRERRARGSWVGDRGRVTFEPVDDMIVRTRSPRAPAVVRDVLVRIQRDLDQDAALAEAVPDPGSWPGAEHRRRFDARLPAHGSRARVTGVHRLFDDAGGGATEEDGATAIDIASSVPPAVAALVRDALALASVPSTETSSAFVLVSRPSAKR